MGLASKPLDQVDVRIVRSLAMHLRDTGGPDVLAAAAQAGGFTPEQLLSGTTWSTTDRVCRVLEAAWEHLGQDEGRFKEAARHRLGEAYGPIRYVLLAATPRLVLRQAAKTIHLVSPASRYQILGDGRTWLRVRYETEAPETEHRLLCLLRQANCMGLPTMWGLPPGKVSERGCVAHGDGGCEYTIQWSEGAGWLPALAGLALGVGLAHLLSSLEGTSLWAWLPTALAGTLAGYAWSLRRAHRDNVSVQEESKVAFQLLAQEEAEARLELQQLHQRQIDWAAVLEQQVGERTATLASVVRQLESLQEKKAELLRGYTHDLRNPFTVMRAMTSLLRIRRNAPNGEWESLLQDHEQAAQTAERIMTELWRTVATLEPAALAPERLEATEAVDKVRRRMRALVFGRDIRVSVFSTREVPQAISIDPLIFDRIVDNLLTNAAKYTERGSIVAELGGTPGFLTLKLSDTGRGIAEDELEQIFRPGGSPAATRAPRSYGLGLSVTVRLLSEIGGRLEVMSKVGAGTTFWVYLPLVMKAAPSPVRLLVDDDPSASSAGDLENVVRIRHVPR